MFKQKESFIEAVKYEKAEEVFVEELSKPGFHDYKHSFKLFLAAVTKGKSEFSEKILLNLFRRSLESFKKKVEDNYFPIFQLFECKKVGTGKESFFLTSFEIGSFFFVFFSKILISTFC